MGVFFYASTHTVVIASAMTTPIIIISAIIFIESIMFHHNLPKISTAPEIHIDGPDDNIRYTESVFDLCLSDFKTHSNVATVLHIIPHYVHVQD